MFFPIVLSLFLFVDPNTSDQGFRVQTITPILAQVPLYNRILGTARLTDDDYIVLFVIIKNPTKNRKLEYKGAASNMFVSYAFLQDDLGNTYKATDFGTWTVGSGDSRIKQIEEVSVYPGESIRDCYVFEKPVAAAKKLSLTIVAKALYQDKDYSTELSKPKSLAQMETEERDKKWAQEEASKRAAQQAKEKKDAEDEAARWRTWKDTTGNFSTRARFSGVISGKVNLKKEDGQTISIPLENLSKEDQDWIKKRK